MKTPTVQQSASVMQQQQLQQAVNISGGLLGRINQLLIKVTQPALLRELQKQAVLSVKIIIRKRL